MSLSRRTLRCQRRHLRIGGWGGLMGVFLHSTTYTGSSARGRWLNSVRYAFCGGGATLSAPSSGDTSRSSNKCISGPEKSNFPSYAGACVDKDRTIPIAPWVSEVLKSRIDPPSSTGTTALFFSFGGRPTCISRHRMASSTVSSWMLARCGIGRRCHLCRIA